MKLWTLSTLCTASLLILSGCTTTPTPKEEVKIDNTLPVIALTQNGVIVDMKTVAFEWSSIKDPRVEGIYIFKKDADSQTDQSLTYYETIKNRFQTHYLDQNVNPGREYTYAFKTFSKDAESMESKPVTITTLPVLESVSWIHSITGMPRSAKIIWRPHVNTRVEAYIVERKAIEDEEWSKLATVKGRLNAEYIDTDLKDNHVYMYRIKVVTYDHITSSPSQSVKVVTKALPQGVDNIHATLNLPKRIQLDWNKSTQKDFERFYVYRSKSIDGSYELVAKLYNNTFTDKIEEDGKSYFYRVSVVDADGLESEYEKVSIHGMTLAKPSSPVILEAKLVGSRIEIQWNRVDPRTKTFLVAKTQKKGWFDEFSEEFNNITVEHFIDNNIEPDSKYKYTVYGLDEYGIKSKASIEAVVETPESTVIEQAPLKKEVKEVHVAPKVDKTQEIIAPIENLDLNEI